MITTICVHRRRAPGFNGPRSARGFNLVEVMIALLVLMLGLGGLAALLINGMASTRTANLRSVAVAHAQTGVDMMRSNLDAYTQGWYAGTNTSGNPATVVSCSGNGCSETQQASNDFAVWRARIASTLPGGVGFICTDATPNDGQPTNIGCDGTGENVVKIFWQDSRDETLGSADTHHRFVTEVIP